MNDSTPDTKPGNQTQFFPKKDSRKSHIFCHAMKKNQLRKDK